MLTKLALLPLVIGIGFEFIMYAGRHDNIIVRILSAPGLWMQRITTREPDLEQIEIAIHALKSSMPDEFPDYRKPSSPDAQEDTDEIDEDIFIKDEDESTDAAAADGTGK